MEVRVFGSARVRPTGHDWTEVGSRKPRSILAALAMHVGRPVGPDQLADLVWSGEPPPAAHGALHAYISGLRKVLDPDRRDRSAPSVLATTDHGYLLEIEAADVDTHRFRLDATRAERVLAPLTSQLGTGEPAQWPDHAAVVAALEDLDSSLATWMGTPYADLLDHPDVVAERAALEHARAAAEQARLLGLLALGENAGVLSTTESRVATDPLQERWWALHCLALTRLGRQAEALEGLRTVRDLLAEELGLDPGPELRALEEAVLRQDPVIRHTLEPRPAPASAPQPVAAAPPDPPTTAAATVGRAAERARLHALLDETCSGRATAAVVVGEPGIGKSWLLDDVAARAAERGMLVARGTCSPDEGAPPLWPWAGVWSVIADDDQALTAAAEGSPQRQAFEISDRIATTVVAASRRQPTLVVLDDLHWADEASLRALRHLLACTPADAPLAVVAGRRSHPEPEGALADVGEAFARRHAVRIDLTGLDDAEAVDLVRSRVGDVLPEAVAVWQRRSAGNPFFLVELARLDDPRPDSVPATVREVMARRLAALSGEVLATLQLAATVGGRFTAAQLVASNPLPAEQLLEHLDDAVAAGLVSEHDAGWFSFVHALTRDAVYASLSASRRARLHAQVAHALETDAAARAPLDAGELDAELARHWLAAGPSHLDRAWRTARGAADRARSVAAYRDAMALRTAAVTAHRSAPGADEADRFDLLLELAQDAAYAAHWAGVEEAALEAIPLARALGSPERVGRAASALSDYSVWMPHEFGLVLEDTIDDLRWALAHVEPDDSATRCRLQLALAVELYHQAGTGAERLALCETGLALARRTADPALLWRAARAATMACWTPALAETRLAWALEGLAAARASGDLAAEAVLGVTAAVAELELGHRKDAQARCREAGLLADRERLPFVQLTLAWLALTTATMQADDAAAGAALQTIVDTAPHVALPMQELHVPGAYATAQLWNVEALGPLIEMFSAADEELQGGHLVHQMLARVGDVDRLRDALARFPLPHDLDENWATIGEWCSEAEAASVADDVALAEHARRILEPYSGRIAVNGAVIVGGPLDGYLALALATLGETDRATELADRAEAVAGDWGLSVYLDWLAGHRRRLEI